MEIKKDSVGDLFDRTYNCPVCENEFKSKQVRTSAIRAKKREKDFHATFAGESPTRYGVICCPYCGYTKFEGDFKEKLSSDQRELIQSKISSKWMYQNFCLERDLDKATRVHLIALANYMITQTDFNTLGKLYLRLAWFYREAEDPENEMKFIRFARDAYRQSFEKENYEEREEKELEILYLMGELSRQLKEYSEAIRWFDKAINHPVAYKNRLIKTYAREQWTLAAEEAKMEATK